VNPATIGVCQQRAIPPRGERRPKMWLPMLSRCQDCRAIDAPRFVLQQPNADQLIRGGSRMRPSKPSSSDLRQACFPFSRWAQVMKKLVLALSVLLLASSSASAWPPLAVFAPGGVQVVPSASRQSAPAPGRLSYFKGSSTMNHRAPYAYPFKGYAPGQPVRSFVRGTLRYYSVN
jgi:hypothetical protein